jgi:sporulation protein YlmC with PRC-barrel domain
MFKHTMTAAALATVLAVPAFAQQPTKMDQPANSATSTQTTMPNQKMSDQNQPATFLQQQSANDWRASKLIGANVYGPNNKSIGDVNDVLISDNGQIKGVVVGVGGFLGVGEKDVALPFGALNVTRKPNSNTIAKITVTYTKDELNKAPKFAYYQAAKSETTGSATTTKTVSPINNSNMKK